MIIAICKIIESILLALLCALSLLIYTRVYWEYRTKGISLLYELHTYAPSSYLGGVGKDPLLTIYDFILDYTTLFFSLAFSFFAGRVGLPLLSLSLYMVLTHSSLSLYAANLILFFVADYLFIITILRFSEGFRDRIYKKFGKPFIDELIGNHPGNKLDFIISAAALGGAAAVAVLERNVQAQVEVETNKQALQLEGNEHRQQEKMQEIESRGRIAVEQVRASSNFTKGITDAIGKIAQSDMANKEGLVENLGKLAEESHANTMKISISHSLVVDDAIKRYTVVDLLEKEPDSSDQKEEQDDNDDGDHNKGAKADHLN